MRGQNRILAIARKLEADVYVNSPGGHDLYEPEVFAECGVQLQFLETYSGSNWSMLHRVLTEPMDELRAEVTRQLSAAVAGRTGDVPGLAD